MLWLSGCHSLPTANPVVFANPGIQMKLTQLAWPTPLVDATYVERAIVRYRGSDWEFTFVAEIHAGSSSLVFKVLSDLGATEYSGRFSGGTVTTGQSCAYLPDAVMESLVWDHAVLFLGPLGKEPRLVTISPEVPNGWALEYTLDELRTLMYQKRRDDGGLAGGLERKGSGRVHRMLGLSIEGTVSLLHGGFRDVREFELVSHVHGYTVSISVVGRE